ncbi:MAG: hypothetical protein OHK0029_41620 [Armatimonadaceae bacterium]
MNRYRNYQQRVQDLRTFGILLGVAAFASVLTGPNTAAVSHANEVPVMEQPMIPVTEENIPAVPSSPTPPAIQVEVQVSSALTDCEDTHNQETPAACI